MSFSISLNFFNSKASLKASEPYHNLQKEQARNY